MGILRKTQCTSHFYGVHTHFDSFLAAKVRTQALHGDIDL